MQRETAGTIITRAAVELGLDPWDNPFTDEDPHARLMYYLLNSLGQHLVREYEWTHLKLAGQIIPVVDQTTYSLPSSFRGMVNQTGWDRSEDHPWIGPLTSQQWAAWTAYDLSGTIAPVFRITGTQFEFQEPPPSALNYEYLTYLWVQGDGESELSAHEVSATGDTVWFDAPLMVQGLKKAFQEAKGLDSTAAALAYDRALSHAMSGDNGAQVLTLSRGRREWLPYPQLPETGFGS